MAILFTLTIRDKVKIRKKYAPKTKVVGDKTKYSRKVKHREKGD